MSKRTLAEWLQGIESLHPREIDLGLERVKIVLERLGLATPPFLVITVGGTNGKGSVVEMLQNALGHHGIRVAAYTSPHLLRFNERMRVDSEPLSDEQILAGINIVDQARGDVPLTYFEFTTLTALVAFRDCGVQVAVMEIGLGGRLDAVNSLDSQVAVVTSIDLDHVEWLGDNRESIGFEKAGIFRHGCPAVVGDPNPPESIRAQAARIQAKLACIGEDFGVRPSGDELEFWSRDGHTLSVPRTDLTGDLGGQNTAVALQVLQSLPGEFKPSPASLYESFGKARLFGRFHRHVDPERSLTWVLDVAHNVAAIGNLIPKIQRETDIRRWHVVLGMLKDKDARESVSLLEPVIDRWYLAPLPGSRGQSGEELATKIRDKVSGEVSPCESVQQALEQARDQAGKGEGILVLGSFQIVGPAMEFLRLYSQTQR
jgi:dihydrofolate synthase/folylpolyglutamate synthase